MAYVGSNVNAKVCQSEDRKAADGLLQTGRKQQYLESEVDPGGGEEEDLGGIVNCYVKCIAFVHTILYTFLRKNYIMVERSGSDGNKDSKFICTDRA